MNLHEYQGKSLFAEYNLPVSKGKVIFSAEDAIEACKEIGGKKWVVKAQELWSDNSISVTVYYKKEEIEEIKSWLKKNYKQKIKSVSFLLHQDHGFKLAPYEPIDKQLYEKLLDKIDPILVSDSNNINLLSDDLNRECEGGACPIK